MKTDISRLKQLDDFALVFSRDLAKGDVVFLNGDLGSGKTTFTQFLVKHLGFNGRVKSPTYAIYESYDLKNYRIIHMDLYRLSSAEELYYLGIEEIFDGENIVVIEWPNKGSGVLPSATKKIDFEMLNSEKRQLELHIT